MPMRTVTTAVTAAAVVLAGAVGYVFVRSQMQAEIYRERLATLSNDYEHLRSTYNEAVTRTAVTELIVKNGHLSVAIRTIQGDEKIIDTPYDPNEEIYVDYVVLNGRLWIRRVFDAKTPPSKACVVDPLLADVDWDKQPAAHGKAVYRKLSEGRWIVTVTGDGSLGLAKRSGDTEVQLAPPPEIKDYSRIGEETTSAIQRIGPREVVTRIVKPN